MKYTIKVNEELEFDLYLSPDGFSIDDHNLGFSKFVKLSVKDGKIVISVLHKEIASISIKDRKLEYTGKIVTSTELREVAEAIKKDSEELLDEVALVGSKSVSSKSPVKTELHTHFMEMLTGKDFLEVLFNFVDKIPVGRDGHLIGYTLDSSGEVIPFMECIEGYVSKEDCAHLISELSLPVNGQKDFSSLSGILTKRNNLVDYVAREMQNKINEEMSIGDVKKIIYYYLLIKSLEYLKKFGIEYVELSYSNDKTIKKILEYGKRIGFPEGIEFNFLLSANRQRFNNPRYVSETKKSLRKMMEQGLVNGFDLMGEELPFSKSDYNVNDPCSFANFVNYALPLLNGYKGSILRLHMGENRRSMSNPLASLEIIDDIITKNSLKVPPPTIRLGHGVFFDKINGTRYEELLRKLGVIVEINASSNYGLGNVEELEEIPYRWYQERGIPFVIATDGGGAYLTDSIQEAQIALSSGEETLKYINETERKIRR